MKTPKVGDYVISLVDEIDIDKGKKYKVIDVFEEFLDIYVLDNTGRMHLLESNQYEIKNTTTKTLDDLEVGDVLVDNAGYELTVLDTAKSNKWVYVNTYTWWAIQNIKDLGWKLKEEADVIEYTLPEIAEKLGVDVNKLRIKE